MVHKCYTFHKCLEDVANSIGCNTYISVFLSAIQNFLRNEFLEMSYSCLCRTAYESSFQSLHVRTHALQAHVDLQSG
jgi:hypothetical protein